MFPLVRPISSSSSHASCLFSMRLCPKTLVIDGLTSFEAKHCSCLIRCCDLALELIGQPYCLLDQLHVGRQDATPHEDVVFQAHPHIPSHHDRHRSHIHLARIPHTDHLPPIV